MSDDLIERHKNEMRFVKAGHNYSPTLAENMAITITALRARLEAVEAERDEALKDRRFQYKQAGEFLEKYDDARAEVARLTAALATARRDALSAVESLRIAKPCEPIDMHDAGYNAAIDEAVSAIRALANEAPE